MQNLKYDIKNIFATKIETIDLNSNDYNIEMKLNQISNDILNFIKLKKDKLATRKEEKQNIKSYLYDDMEMDSNVSKDITLDTNYTPKQNSVASNIAIVIPDNFSLTYEMKQYALFKFVQNVDDVFEHFKLHYQSNQVLKSDWEAVWKIWILNQNKYGAMQLIKTTIDEHLKLESNYIEIAKKYLKKEEMEVEFIKFKNYYISNGDIKVHSAWEKVWENWCINFKNFKPKEQTKKAKDKADYRWDFRQAKESSDKIKNWLEFEKKINWLEDFYLKDIALPGIGWSEVIHPDYNKEEILLFKIDSPNGQFMLNNKSTNKNDDIIDIQIVEDN